MNQEAEISTAERRDGQEDRKMTKAVVMGCACVVFSELTRETVERFRRYEPEALIMEDENGNTFTLDLDDGPGSLTEDHAVLSRTTSEDGRATITLLLDPEAPDKLCMAREKLGPAMIKLEAMEKQLMERTDSLAEEERRVNALFSWL